MRRTMTATSQIRCLVITAVVTMLVMSLSAPHAQQSGAQQSGATALPAKPIVPVAASTVARNPDTYYGEPVSMTAAVEQTVARLAFTVDQDKTKSTGNEILVLAPRLHSPVDLNTYVTIIGEVVRFDPTEAAKRMKDAVAELSPAVVEKYRGKPAVLATAVIVSGSMEDLARWMPPPMTAEEAAYDKLMKGVGPANAALRKGVEGENADVIKQQSAVLTKAFTDAEAFWKARGKADAVKFAQDARKAAELIAQAGAAATWDQAKTQLATLGQQCQSCHSAYRERGEDGTFYMKPGSR